MVDRKYADRDIDALMDIIKILTPLTADRRRTVLSYAWESVNLTEGDKVPPPDAPKPPRQKPGRKPRAALGSSPLADAKGGSPHPSYTPPPARPPITGADGLSPEAGADPGPLSELAAAALRQAGRS